MNRSRRLLLALLLLVPVASIYARQPTASITLILPYTLPRDLLQKAITLSHIRNAVYFFTIIWNFGLMVLLLKFGVPAKFRDWTTGTFNNRWLQGLIFIPLLTITMTLIGLPIEIFMQQVDRIYHLSIQTWQGWIWDQVKSLLLVTLFAYFAAMLLRLFIRKFPRKWWVASWLISVPFIVFIIFIAPMMLEPIFDDFQPLQKANPVLVTKLQQVLEHGGVVLPANRFKLMQASEKTTQLNAYVSGLGASKQVVVWDTTTKKMTDDEIQFVVGHELGHYVLHHIPKGTAFACLLTLAMFYFGYWFLQWSLGRWGMLWRIPDQQDWGALMVLTLAFSIFGFVTSPISSGFSRHIEHEADVYGMEVTHGVIANPKESARQSFQVLGETSLVSPYPNSFVEFWTGSHPSIPDRVIFVQTYDPWVPGKTPQFFKK